MRDEIEPVSGPRFVPPASPRQRLGLSRSARLPPKWCNGAMASVILFFLSRRPALVRRAIHLRQPFAELLHHGKRFGGGGQVGPFVWVAPFVVELLAAIRIVN